MNKLLTAFVALAIIAAGAHAAAPGDTVQPASCEEKALDKNGKPLTGATKAAFVKKCAGEASPVAAGDCEEKAVGKNGKKLAGAAKTAFMKKCAADAAGAK
ncbi:MAG: hypothetical protein M0P39_09655 [Rhodocyclaceae bacterium]|nr:hypothetical protein [Rhodocyclaceae bacterium]